MVCFPPALPWNCTLLKITNPISKFTYNIIIHLFPVYTLKFHLITEEVCPQLWAILWSDTLPFYREARVWAVEVDVIPRPSRGNATTITSQNILTSSLKVKGPAVKGVVVRVAKDCTHAWLWSRTKKKKALDMFNQKNRKKSKKANAFFNLSDLKHELWNSSRSLDSKRQPKVKHFIKKDTRWNLTANSGKIIYDKCWNMWH